MYHNIHLCWVCDSVTFSQFKAWAPGQLSLHPALRPSPHSYLAPRHGLSPPPAPVCMHLPVLDISHEWNPVRRIFASLTWVHPCAHVFLCVDGVFIHWPASDHLHRLSSWLSWVTLLWTFVYKPLCGHVLFFLGRPAGTGLLNLTLSLVWLRSLPGLISCPHQPTLVVVFAMWPS